MDSYEVFSIEDIRKYCTENPDTNISLRWFRMLYELDELEADYTFSDFLDERDELVKE